MNFEVVVLDQKINLAMIEKVVSERIDTRIENIYSIMNKDGKKYIKLDKINKSTHETLKSQTVEIVNSTGEISGLDLIAVARSIGF